MFNLFKILQIISIVLINSITLQSQKITREWIARFNHTSDDKAHQIVIDNIGNIYVAGESDASPNGYTDYVTLKYNNIGVLEWARFYDGLSNNQNNDRAKSVAVDYSENCYVTGNSNSIPFPYGSKVDIVTIKYDPSGEIEWLNRYEYSYALKIEIDINGDIIVAGSTVNDVLCIPEFLLIKYSPSGELIWYKTNPTAGYGDNPSNMTIDDYGNIYLTGSNNTGNLINYKTVKYDKEGFLLWTAIYEGQTSYSEDIAVDKSGNVYITGQSWGGSTWNDIVTVKYDSSGNELWSARYNGKPGSYGLHDKGIGVAADDYGFAYVTGWSSVTDDADIVLIKYDQTGDTVWTQRYNGSGNSYDFPYDILLDRDGNIYIAGYSYGASDNADYIVLKYSTEGSLIWSERYNGPGNSSDVASSIVIDSKDNVYVTGWSRSSGNLDIATIKYSQQLSEPTDLVDETFQNDFHLFNSYPNPFNARTTIKFSIPQSEHVTLSIINILGQPVAQLVSKEMAAGTHTISWDATDLPSGAYFCFLNAGEKSFVNKILLLK